MAANKSDVTLQDVHFVSPLGSGVQINLGVPSTAIDSFNLLPPDVFQGCVSVITQRAASQVINTTSSHTAAYLLLVLLTESNQSKFTCQLGGHGRNSTQRGNLKII